ncbi:ribosomal protein S7 domain-containing protein [Microdochium trichocladiopsis]|uniref:Small ribosomal subunit protein uS7m n=1 Tax=Microdochium trichocladiopsis TaxID=1682393 RepID=A0A9P9BNK5_9PEZI|nr:ribosomal protein S7 domain-containing protein [Microdochium trichocladiopsis]KAH7020953.1 ribosomal protein S7 domain-containing protein [Microdochium trichocladiopsis]
MASRANPWTALRGLSIRTRALRTSCTQQQTRPTPALLIHKTIGVRRDFTDNRRHQNANTSSTQSTSSSSQQQPDSAVPPPPPPSAPGTQVGPYHELFAPNFLNTEAIAALEKAAAEAAEASAGDGLLFHMPDRVGKHEQLQDRYHPVVHQITRLLMRDGKLSKAQTNMGLILNHLRTSPPPKINPLRPLLPGAPPPSQLPLNPLLYLTLAIESVAPMVRIFAMKGQAGGGRALEVPTPLPARTRRRLAVNWILDAVNKKKSRGSGRGQFAARFGDEIIAIVEGRSSLWDRRQVLHKLATVSRANLNNPKVSGTGGGKSKRM